MTVEKTYRFLVADDDHISRQLMLTVLAPFAERIVTAENGEQVLLAVAQEEFDFVFLDVHMPIMDGIEAMEHITAILPADRIPLVIAITASGDGETVARCLRAGMRAHVSKPLDRGSIRLIIEQWQPAVAAKSQSGNDELLDMNRIRELKELQHSAATEAVVSNLLSLFRTECPAQIEELKRTVTTNDVQRIVEVNHKLKGSLLNVGFRAAAAQCEQLENIRETADTTLFLETIAHLEELFRASFEEFSQYLRVP